MAKANKKKKKKKEYDFVKAPHYDSISGQDAIDVLEDFEITDPLIWNAIKYLLRVGKKPGNDIIQELQKSIKYISRRIGFLKIKQKSKKKKGKK